MIRPITQSDEAEVVLRANAALGCDRAATMRIRWIDGRVVGFIVKNMPSEHVTEALGNVGICPNPAGWTIDREYPEEDPAFPSDGGVERPIASIRWYPTFYVPNGATCPFCDAPVIPCEAQRPDGPPCAHARWKPAPSSRGTVYAHSACVDAAEAHDSAAKACREWEGAKAEEARAWELAKIATELRLRAEKTYQDAMAGRVP